MTPKKKSKKKLAIQRYLEVRRLIKAAAKGKKS
jgi:hypothetical protein